MYIISQLTVHFNRFFVKIYKEIKKKYEELINKYDKLKEENEQLKQLLEVYQLTLKGGDKDVR